MVKKLLALFIVVLMMFSFTACEMDEDSLGMLMMLMALTQSEQAYDGTYEDGVFTSPGLGFSITLGEEWDVATLDDIMSEMGNADYDGFSEASLMLSFMAPQFTAAMGNIEVDPFAFVSTGIITDTFSNIQSETDGAFVSLISMDFNLIASMVNMFGGEGEVMSSEDIEVDFWESVLEDLPNEVTDEYEIYSEVFSYPVGDGEDSLELLAVEHITDGSYMITVMGFVNGQYIILSGIAFGDSYIITLKDVLSTVEFFCQESQT